VDNHLITVRNEGSAPASEERFEVRWQPGDVQGDRARIGHRGLGAQRIATINPHPLATCFRDHSLIGPAYADSIDIAVIRGDVDAETFAQQEGKQALDKTGAEPAPDPQRYIFLGPLFV